MLPNGWLWETAYHMMRPWQASLSSELVGEMPGMSGNLGVCTSSTPNRDCCILLHCPPKLTSRPFKKSLALCEEKNGTFLRSHGRFTTGLCCHASSLFQGSLLWRRSFTAWTCAAHREPCVPLDGVEAVTPGCTERKLSRTAWLGLSFISHFLAAHGITGFLQRRLSGLEAPSFFPSLPLPTVAADRASSLPCS